MLVHGILSQAQYAAEVAVPAPVGPAVTTNMLFYLDASNTSSYPGSGTTWTDLENSLAFTLNGTPVYTSDGDASYFSFDNNANSGASFSGTGFSPQPGTNGGVHAGAWIYKTNFGGGLQYQNICRYPNTGNDLLFAFQNFDTYLTTGIETNAGFTELDTSISSGNYSNQWVYVCANFDAGTSTITTYRNGSSIGSTTRSGAITNRTNTSVDVGWWNTAEFITARFALVHFHDGSLSAANVLDNFNAMKSRFGL